MTLCKSGPYTSTVIHPRTAIVPLALAITACATTGPASNPELTELKAEVRALREENARLEKRLNRMELTSSLGTRPPSSASAPVTLPSPMPPPADAMPSLTVVKLKPKSAPAPKLATATPIVEPSSDAIEALKRAASSPPSDASPELDTDIGDAFYEQGVAALKTGNVEGGVADLQRFAAEAPKHPHADNAIYFAGLGLMGLNDFEGAARAFEDVVARYPAGDAVLESLLKLGECRVRLNKPADARVVYQKIVSSYPGTSAATAAKARLSSLTGSP